MYLRTRLFVIQGFVIVLLLLFTLSVHAKETYELQITPLVDRISVEDVAKYNVTISNNRAVKEEFRIYTLAYPEWDIMTDPLINPIHLEVPPFSKSSLILFLDPLHVVSVGHYQIDLYARSLLTDNVVNSPIEVTIKSTEPLIEGYVPTVLLNLDMPKKIDPKDKIKLNIKLANQNSLDYPEITIIIKSNLINEQITEKLGPREDKVIEVVKEIPITTEPQSDNVVASLIRGNRTIERIVLPIEIIGYSNIKSDSNYQKKFLKVEQFVKFSNDGNLVSDVPLKVKSDLFRELFSITKPKSVVRTEAGVRYYVWEQSIQPYESFDVVVIENYRPLFLLMVMIIIGVGLYYYYRAPLVFKKSVKNIIKSHGGISQMQVSLSVKNRGNSALNNIEITDTIPNLVHLEKGLLIGTLHPSKILGHEKKGTIVKWEIKDIDAGEERVITYNVKSRLAILGGLTLPIANAKFIYQGKEYTNHSNKLEIKI